MTDASRSVPDCIFCVARDAGDEPLVVHRGAHAFVILNKFPYNNGHLMVVPNRHAGRLSDFGSDEILEVVTLAQATERSLDAVYRPHGFNMGINVGKPAGAGILNHLHVHVVPRWDGDTSFMTVSGETRVLPEDLSETARRVRTVFADELAAVARR